MDAGCRHGVGPGTLGGAEVLILSTHGGIRAADGTPIALGYHTGHWEVGLLMEAAAEELKAAGAVPFAAYCTDPCDGRTQGTTGMFDSLPYRNDAAIVFRRLIRSLPTRRGVIGVATCDKGLPAMMMALAGTRDLPCVLVPGGVTLLAADGEDAARADPSARASRAARSRSRKPPRSAAPAPRPAADASSWARPPLRRWSAKRSACRSRTARWRLPAIPSGSTWRAAPPAPRWNWKRAASRCATSSPTPRAQRHGDARGLRRLHQPHPAPAAIAHAAGLAPHRGRLGRVNRRVPRLVDALPNGPRNFPPSRSSWPAACPK
jgi:xylonate dehydratase